MFSSSSSVAVALRLAPSLFTDLNAADSTGGAVHVVPSSKSTFLT
jgi:hypothetical protein